MMLVQSRTLVTWKHDLIFQLRFVYLHVHTLQSVIILLTLWGIFILENGAMTSRFCEIRAHLQCKLEWGSSRKTCLWRKTKKLSCLKLLKKWFISPTHFNYVQNPAHSMFDLFWAHVIFIMLGSCVLIILKGLSSSLLKTLRCSHPPFTKVSLLTIVGYP